MRALTVTNGFGVAFPMILKILSNYTVCNFFYSFFFFFCLFVSLLFLRIRCLWLLSCNILHNWSLCMYHNLLESLTMSSQHQFCVQICLSWTKLHIKYNLFFWEINQEPKLRSWLKIASLAMLIWWSYEFFLSGLWVLA